MKKAIAILAVLSLAAYAGQIAVEMGTVPEKDADWLVYDDGTFNWLTWGGTYRGVWFNTEDFVPGTIGAEVQQAEMWFYHHASYPWDSSDFYMELWNGDAMGPMMQLDQTMVTALHLAPVYADYDPAMETEQNFWSLANTEMSAGGWPSLLGDDSQGGLWGGAAHSLFSDDFIVWEPWVIGAGPCNYFISVYADLIIGGAFDNTSWGSLKTAF